MAAKSTKAVLQEVIDREEIRTLPVRYCHTVWQKDLDGYVSLFTERLDVHQRPQPPAGARP